MKRPSFLKSAPALAVILALASTSAHGSTNVRGGATAVDKKAAAQSTAVQSAQQAGSIDSDSSVEGVARRARTGSFLNRAADVIKRVVTGKAPVVTENAITEKDRELAAHLADAETFIRKISENGSGAVALESEDLSPAVKVAIFYGANNEEKKKMYALVDELSKSDEDALLSLFVLANYRDAARLAKEKPERAAGLNRIEAKLKAAGLAHADKDGNWYITTAIAPSILAAPGARALLHKLTDSEAQRANRENLAIQRASILNVTKAHQSIERMQLLKKYILSVYEESGVQIYYPSQFMNKLDTGSSVSANGGVILVFANTPYPLGISTAHGSIYYAESTYPRSWSRADEYFKKYKEDLGLELVSVQPHTGYQEYAVTRLPDGTRIPKANQVEDAPVSHNEIRQLVLDIPERARQGIKVESE